MIVNSIEDREDGLAGRPFSGIGRGYRDWQAGNNTSHGVDGGGKPPNNKPPSNNEGVAAAVATIVGVGVGIALAWNFRDGLIIAATGSVLAAGVDKAAKELSIKQSFRIAAVSLTLLATTAAVYAVATNYSLPEGSIISQYWQNRGPILMGVGAVAGSYIYLRDRMWDKVGASTAIKCAMSVAAIAGGLYLNSMKSPAEKSSLGYATISALRLNLRTCASTDCLPIVEMRQGDKIALLKYGGNQWWQVSYPTRDGKISGYARAKDDRGNILFRGPQ